MSISILQTEAKLFSFHQAFFGNYTIDSSRQLAPLKRLILKKTLTLDTFCAKIHKT